jgi:hypothetical protein
LLVAAAGFGAGWTLAEAFDADTGTVLLVAFGAAVLAYVLVLVASAFLFFVGGLCVGCVIGSKLYVLAAGDSGNLLLVLIVVPTVAVLCGLLASRWRRPFLVWATALAGAALVLSAIGRLWADAAGEMWSPQTAAGALLAVVLWVALAIGGHQIQSRAKDPERER